MKNCEKSGASTPRTTSRSPKAAKPASPAYCPFNRPRRKRKMVRLFFLALHALFWAESQRYAGKPLVQLPLAQAAAAGCGVVQIMPTALAALIDAKMVEFPRDDAGRLRFRELREAHPVTLGFQAQAARRAQQIPRV